jgi:hypothetical protein
MGAAERELQSKKNIEERVKEGRMDKEDVSKYAMPVKKKVGRPKKIIMDSSSSESKKKA